LANYLIFDKQFITYIVILYNYNSFTEIKNLRWSWPLSAPPDRPSRNRGGPISKGRDISFDWPQNGTTSLKYEAQRECRVPNSSHILLMENKLRKFFVIQKDANLCLKCTKIRLPARLCLSAWTRQESLSTPPDPLAAIKGSYF